MTTFLKEVARKSTWMLALKLGCTNDGNKRIATSKGATTWGFKTRETKSQERPPCSNVVGNGNGEITSIITKGEDVTFDNVGSHSPPKCECEESNEPLPSKGKCIDYIPTRVVLHFKHFYYLQNTTTNALPSP